MSDGTSRNGTEPANFEYYYLVMGDFGDNWYDTFVQGTRWVPLYELMHVCSDADIVKLDEFDVLLQVKMSALAWP